MVSGRLETLDFLRGQAILAVIVFHLFGIFHNDIRWISFVAGLGYLGVQLFFLVSALTMCLMWDRRQGEALPRAKFYIRRLFRIGPPFWLAIAFYCLLDQGRSSEWAPDGIGIRQVIATASLLHTFWPDTINSVVPGGWSIGVEVLFYLAFPFVVTLSWQPISFLVFGFGIYLLNLFIVRSGYLVVLKGYPHPHLVDEFLYFQFFNQAPIFFIGIYIYRSLAASLRRAAAGCAVGSVWLATAFLLKLVFGMNSSPFFWSAVAALSIFVACVLAFKISLRPIAALGRYSYSIYLAHFAIIRCIAFLFAICAFEVQTAQSFVIALPAAILLCLVVGRLLSATVEKLSSIWSAALIDRISV